MTFCRLATLLKNQNFAHFPPFSATFNTLTISLYHRDNKNVSTGFFSLFFIGLQAFSFYFHCLMFIIR